MNDYRWKTRVKAAKESAKSPYTVKDKPRRQSPELPLLRSHKTQAPEAPLAN